VVHLTKIDPVFEKIGEGATSEGDGTIVLGNLVVAPFGDNTPAVEIGDQFAEGLEVEVPAEDGADDLGLSLFDGELLVLGVITKRNGPTGPFALAP
jgi:hypothetical protein